MKTILAVTLARGILALIVGVALIFYPDKTRPMLVNFMGMSWLMSGLVSVRLGVQGDRAQWLPKRGGFLGVLPGIVVLGRIALRGVMAEEWIIIKGGLGK